MGIEREADSMKIILKILFAPVVAALAIFVYLFAAIVGMSAWIFGLAGTILGILGLFILILDNATNGIIVLVFAFLVSPYGLPMLAVWLVGQLQRLRYFIQDAVYG
jgi:hypothetical protein